MSIELPLERMTVAEKLEVMEAIWESLCAQPADVPAPEWHGEVLADRKRRLETGEATVSNWDEAKKRLQDLGQ